MVAFKNQNNLMVASVCFYKGGKTKLKSYQISKKKHQLLKNTTNQLEIIGKVKWGEKN